MDHRFSDLGRSPWLWFKRAGSRSARCTLFSLQVSGPKEPLTHVRIESQFIHAEVVKPALALLTAKEYAEANAEFLTALEHYRKGETKQCLNECLKTFESTMKAICTKRKWAVRSKDTAKELIDVCLKNGLTPPLIHSHIRGVRATLARGIPTIRNRPPGHGQELELIEVPPHYARYMLNLTAATIHFLIESEKAFK